MWLVIPSGYAAKCIVDNINVGLEFIWTPRKYWETCIIEEITTISVMSYVINLYLSFTRSCVLLEYIVTYCAGNRSQSTYDLYN